MRVLFIASEAVPFASTGGLGDVIGSLPAAIKKASPDSDIRVILPLYGSTKRSFADKLAFIGDFSVSLSWRRQYCGVFLLEKDGVKYYFLDNEYYFKRNFIYGEFDDGERFAFFARAALEVMPVIDFYPDILHAHDWQSAPAVIYLNRIYSRREEYSGIKSIFTIHNIQYQGIYGFELLGDVFGLNKEDAETVAYDGCINLVKGAVVCADAVSTVSPTYAKEILSPEFSHGLHFVLEQNKGKLTGILNGIDYDYYNPAKDRDTAVRFSRRSIDKKEENKKALCSELGLEYDGKPLIAIISRLVGHKGLDLVTLAADDLIDEGFSMAVLGTGDHYFEDFFRSLAVRHPGRVRTVLKFDKPLAKRIYAGADIFLMPSKSEPCGLAQMIASRYGTVPIVHETGGLYDSIKDIGWQSGGNGFTFAAYSAWEMLGAAKRAKALYGDRESWNALVKKVMGVDFSWKGSAGEYLKLYSSVAPE